jgi:hypothetical protein
MRLFLINIISILLIISVMGSLQSCRQEIDMDLTDTIETLPVELINTNISGQVKNKNGKVLKGASVEILDQQNICDDNGYFMFENIKADRNGTVIIVKKPGYLENRVTVYPSLNHDLFSSIILNEDNSLATMLSWEGGSVDLGKYGTLYISPNTLVYDSDGSNFEGNAEIKYQVFEPKDENFEKMIPGELIGYTGTTRKALIPAAVVSISITDGKLNKLRLAREQNAELVLPASDHYLNNWTDDIKIYRYDTTLDKWYNKGTAIATGENSYIGEIHDFGCILFGLDHNVVKLEGSISYKDNESTARHQVNITSDIQLPNMKSVTDEQGYFTAWVPENVDILLEIRNECGFNVHEEQLGKIEDNLSYEKELEANQNCRSVPVKGKLLDCDGNPVENGYVRITSAENDLFILTDKNGIYEGEFKVCNEDVVIGFTAFDRTNNHGTIQHSGYPVNNAINIADWKVCHSEGSTGLQFRDKYYFINEGINYVVSTGVLLYLGESDDIYIDCWIKDFRGEDVYTIPSPESAEFLITITANDPDAISLVPKTLYHSGPTN